MSRVFTGAQKSNTCILDLLGSCASERMLLRVQWSEKVVLVCSTFKVKLALALNGKIPF